MDNFFNRFIKDLKIPKEAKLDISRNNIRILKIISWVLIAFGVLMDFVSYMQHRFRTDVWVYYSAYILTGIVSQILVMISTKVNRYLFNQGVVINATSLMMITTLYGIYMDSYPDSGLITFYIIFLLLIIFFDISPYFHLISAVGFCLILGFFSRYAHIPFGNFVLANNATYSAIAVLLAFYKRKLTVRSVRQKMKIDEQTKQLQVQNIELSNQNDSLQLSTEFLQGRVSDQSEIIHRQENRLLKIQENTIISLSNLVENRDSDTGAHVLRTRDYVGVIARKAMLSGKYPELDDHMLEIYQKAAPMHDIGKIVVPDAVLKKPGKLTPEEFELIKLHTVKGGQIVEEVLGTVEDADYVRVTKDIATFHHEKYDGSGYPQGLKGEEIPLCARIMAIADVFDALVSPRCYKEPYPVEEAIRMIEESAGTHFDPELIKIFIDSRDEFIEVLNRYQD